MKTMKKLIPALAMLLVSAVLLGTSTFAWFSMNTTVRATGMKVKAETSGSLIIKAATTLPTSSDTITTYDFAELSSTLLYSSTHDSTYATYNTGLKYVTNENEINPETGTALNSGVTLTYANAANTVGHLYFKDYSFYIAAAGAAFSGQDIVVSLAGVIANSENVNKAVSVDFYGALVDAANAVPDITSGNYKGTLNVAGVYNTSDKTSDTKTSFEIENVNIPQADGSGAYAITMRVYYDGALIETPGANAYTAYKAGTGTKPAADAPYYYLTNNGVGVADVAVGASVTGYYVVDDENSTYTFARTVEIANVSDVTLTATFTSKAHD